LLTHRRGSRGQAALFLAALISIAPAQAIAGLVGIAGNYVLYDINTTNGAATNPRTVGNKVNMIAYSPSGTLYGASQGTPSDVPPGGMLYQINPTTGAATLIATLSTFIFTEGDIAFDPTSGILYAVDGPGQLLTINTTNGACTAVGAVGINLDLSAMAFDAAGNLYIVESFSQTLLKVNKSTAAVIASLPMGSVEQQVGGLAFVPANGTLFYAGGIPSKFYSVNTGTGAGTLIGSIAPTDGIWGLTLIPDPTPTRDTTWGRLKTLFR
jgi:DNA-binding beta-propeller fold protein YncE